MAVPFPLPTLGLLPLAVLGGVFVLGLAGLAVGPAIVTSLRQSGYERAVARELVRLEVILPANVDLDAGATAELIRALHPGQRRGVDRFRVGWPPIELRLLWRTGAMHWQVDCPRQLVPSIEMSVHSVLSRCELVEDVVDDAVPAAVATAKLASSLGRFLRVPDAGEATVPERLAVALTRNAVADAEIVLRVRLMPGTRGDDEAGTRVSIASFLLSTILDAVLMRPTTAVERAAPDPPADQSTSFAAALSLEAAGTSRSRAAALLWRLVGATDPLRSGSQALIWRVREGSDAAPSSIPAEPELVAALWALPDRSFDGLGVGRERGVAGATSATPRPGQIVIAESRSGPLGLAPDVLTRHLAVFGATGSGKTTLLLNLVLGLAEAGIGATVIDPHGDLSADILGRLPSGMAGKVHVLRLADRDHPRGFNFLERRASEAGLVTSEFVTLFVDLWPNFTGPKMQHYLRNALMTLLAHPEQQTILELIRLLRDDRFRERYLIHVTDPLVRAFWRLEWPGPKERERDASIKAVLNKLGAFASYESLRFIVGQGTSTISPRSIMDHRDLCVVDLSGVGGDNATLFGAMLIGRYAIDAMGRQGTPIESRHQHVLIVDEAPRFDTSALARIHDEGRKFGLSAVLAAQSLPALRERLGTAVVTNAASIALLQPGAADVQSLARLFAPLSRDELLGLRRFEVALRTAGLHGAPVVLGGTVRPPCRLDPARADAFVRQSDAADAVAVDRVENEVFKRSGGPELAREDAGPGAPDIEK